VAADTGEQEWVFETDSIDSSPTVVDGTVFVVGDDRNLYAVDADIGDQEWAFKTDHGTASSPTVVDGTVFVGSDDNNLYAVAAGVNGSSEGSRVSLGTLGHHDEWRYADQSITIPASALYMSRIRNNSVVLAGGVGGVLLGGYFIRRRRQPSGQSQEGVSEPTGESSDPGSTGTNEPPATATDGTTANSESISIRSHVLRNKADTYVTEAKNAQQNGDLTEAISKYQQAINDYKDAVDELSVGANRQRSEIKEDIDTTRGDLETVKTRHEQRSTVIEALQPAEQSIQEAIVAFVNGDQTIARIRFRQARDSFEAAAETIKASEENPLDPPIEATVEPDRELNARTLNELGGVAESAVSALSEAGIDTVGDLDTPGEAPWTPKEVTGLADAGELNEEAVTKLTVLSWWQDDESYEYSSAEVIKHRQQQADYGFEQAK
jgi:tetratricopeptide (TPR) repeat protein